MTSQFEYKCKDVINLLPEKYQPNNLTGGAKLALNAGCLINSNNAIGICNVGLDVLKVASPDTLSKKTLDYLKRQCPDLLGNCIPMICNKKNSQNNKMILKCQFVNGLIYNLIHNGDITKHIKSTYGVELTVEDLLKDLPLVCSILKVHSKGILNILPTPYEDMFRDTFEDLSKCMCKEDLLIEPSKSHGIDIQYLTIFVTTVGLCIIAAFTLVGILIGGIKNGRCIQYKTFGVMATLFIALVIIVIINPGGYYRY